MSTGTLSREGEAPEHRACEIASARRALSSPSVLVVASRALSSTRRRAITSSGLAISSSTSMVEAMGLLRSKEKDGVVSVLLKERGGERGV